MKNKLLVILFLIGCSDEVAVNISVPTPTKKLNCNEVKTQETLRHGTVDLPTAGMFVEESHYANRDESFGAEKRLFPKTVTENIDRHLENSCKLLRVFLPMANCALVYGQPWQRQWTPSESGQIGQGARGNSKPDEISELFQGNMMFARGYLPPRGTRYIMTNKLNGRKIVVNFGYEVGPGSPKWLGGITREVNYYLETVNGSILNIGKASDQTLPMGPLFGCE